MAGNPSLLAVGPVFFGVILNWGLLGAFLVQIYIYAVWYHQTDRGVVRYLVYALLCVEGLQTSLMTHTGWEMLAAHWGDPAIIQNIPWSAGTPPILCGIVATMVQLYFCWRIWLLAANNVVTRVVSIVCVMVSLTQCIAAIIYGAEFIAQDLKTVFFLEKEAKLIAIVWLGCTTACDVMIAVSLVWIFTAAKSRSLARTGSLLNRLIIQTIQSGVITAIFSVLHLAAFLKYPSSLLHVALVYVLSKLYPNVLLANLNNRKRLSMRGTTISEGISIPGDDHTFRSIVPSASSPGTRIGLFPNSGGIEMTISNHVFSDRDDELRKGRDLSNIQVV